MVLPYLLSTYGGSVTFRTPGVTVGIKYGTVAVLGGVAFATALDCDAESDEAIAASDLFVLSKPSGYVKILLPSSPGRPYRVQKSVANPGWKETFACAYEWWVIGVQRQVACTAASNTER